MEDIKLLRLHPTLEIIADEMTEAGIPCALENHMDQIHYRGVRLFIPGCELAEDIVYVLRPEDAFRFPVDEYAYVCATHISGQAGHICCTGQSTDAILGVLLDLFSRYQRMDMELDDLVYRGSGLHELCETGAKMLNNPVCIHDDWFIMIAMSRELPNVLLPDHIMASSKEFVPQAIVEDFKFDNDYLETYSHRTAQFWNASPDTPPCLYVNLWEGSVYRGRLLTVKYHREFRKADYMLAEVLTQRAMILLRIKNPGQLLPYRSMDDIVYDLLNKGEADPKETAQFLRMMGWGKGDSLVCVRVRSQQNDVAPVLEHVLHSDLFRTFPNSYIIFTGHQQCVILNTSQVKNTQFSALRHRLAPLCRDYCLYAGISSPVNGIWELHLAYHQAEVALNQVFKLRNDRWIIPFSDCALDYIQHNLLSPLQPQHLAAPELYFLMAHDREKGTQYFETLRMYLLQERDIPKTSEALIIHRTTLIYRLKKIQALTELDLEDPEVRLYLLLSLRMVEREQR